MRRKLKLGDRYFMVDLIDRHPLKVSITEGEQTRQTVIHQQLTHGAGRIRIDEIHTGYTVSESPTEIWVTLAGQTFCFQKSKGRIEGPAELMADFGAPMPGKVTRVPAAAGDRVTKGQVLVVMEAMKMEHRIEAPANGTVTAVHCRVDTVVDQGFTLLDFTADD